MKQSHYTIIALVLIAVAFALVAFFYKSQQGEQASQKLSQHREALVRQHSMQAGSAEARVTLVEFFDPACGTCAQFHPLVKELMAQHDGKLKLVVRYAPLHPGSDRMVALLEAARLQGQFWEMLEFMYVTQTMWTVNHVADADRFLEILATANAPLDLARLRSDMDSPEIAQMIRQDVSDGQQLGATKTPTFFVNGKPLPSFGYEQLTALVAAEIAASY